MVQVKRRGEENLTNDIIIEDTSIHNDQKDHPPNVFLIVTSNKITPLTKAWGKGLRYYYDYMD